MKLYYAETINPRKACAVAKYLNSPLELVHVDLGKGEHKQAPYVAINPNGKVPTLVDGSLRLWESNAIMGHLARRADSDLWPSDERQIEVLRWLSWDSEHFGHHAGTLYFEYIIKPKFSLGETDPAAVEEATGYFRKFANILNSHLKGRKYLLGDTLTIADFAVGVTLPYAARAHIPIGEFAEVERWHARLNELPAWRDPFPAQTSAAA
jgi:glutathione S-transferase